MAPTQSTPTSSFFSNSLHRFILKVPCNPASEIFLPNGKHVREPLGVRNRQVDQQERCYHSTAAVVRDLGGCGVSALVGAVAAALFGVCEYIGICRGRRGS